jgi:hypothetical protein
LNVEISHPIRLVEEMPERREGVGTPNGGGHEGLPFIGDQRALTAGTHARARKVKGRFRRRQIDRLEKK